MFEWAVSSEVERFVDTEEVSGSIPLSPTIINLQNSPFSYGKFIRPECCHAEHSPCHSELVSESPLLNIKPNFSLFLCQSMQV